MNRSYINTASFAAFLSKKNKFVFTLFLIFSLNLFGQTYTITGNINSSSLNCTTFTGNNIISIGNGTTTPSSLIMDENLDLSNCSLGPIQIIVNNATIDFTTANKRLYLPEGSSISFINSGTLNPPGGNGGGCTGNDRIYIGGVLLSTCQGGAGTIGFEDLIDFGGSGSTTSNSPVCVGNSINLSASPPPNGDPFTYTWYEPSVSATTSIGTGQNISIASATSGTHIYQVKMFSASLNKTMIGNATVVVNSGATTAAPTVTTTQPTCTVSTGTITITAPTGMNYSIDGLTYTNSTGIFTSLAPGTYSVTAKNSSGCISNATSVVVKNATNIWNGATWSNGSNPISTENIVFNAFYLSNSDLSACSCQANADVTIRSGTLTLTNGLTVANGVNMVFEDDSSLVQINSAANSGVIKYNRSTRSRNTDYTYWSSPVSNQTLFDLSPLSLAGTSYSYESTATSEDWKLEDSSTTMLAGKGYIVRGPESSGAQTPPTTAFDVEFYGVPNNGTYPISVYSGKSCLLGNPYPSAIDADTFLTANATVLSGTIYFWTHNTAIQPTNPSDTTLGTGAFAYTSNDYATYNITGGVGIDIGSSTGPSLGGTTIPTGKIAAGQGFFATSIAAGTVTFTNSMRIAGNNSQFFKKRNSKTEKIIEKNRIWLNLTNTQGAFKQTLVGYITGATNDYDDRFDGESFDGNEFVDFYSLNQDKNLVIQGRALPFDENDEIPLGYRSTINGDFTINIDQTDGLLTNQAVFLEDKLTQMVFDLKSGNYTFNTVAGTFNDRFVLRYKDNSTAKTLGKPTVDTIENKVLVSNKNKQIKINSNSETIDKVMVYDVSGKLMYKKEKANSQEVIISNLTAKNQVLIVKTTLQNGKTVTDKIVN